MSYRDPFGLDPCPQGSIGDTSIGPCYAEGPLLGAAITAIGATAEALAEGIESLFARLAPSQEVAAAPAADATDASTTASRGGESAAAQYGRSIHATYDYGPDFEREFQLANGKRADAVNFMAREVVELKPNNPAAIARGLRQVRGYAAQLDQQFPGTPFTYRVITYERP